MARWPVATWAPLPENARQRAITPRAVILHTAVDGRGDSDLPGYFGRADVGAESHFWVPMRKRPVQMMDTEVEADANAVADKWAISVETEDDSAGKAHIAPWNDKQITELIALIEWAIATHDIPRRLCSSAYLPSAAGIGYHSMPMRERFNGTSHNPWTSYQGKTCPGDARVEQFYDVIAPAILNPTTPPQEDDMEYKDWSEESKRKFWDDFKLFAAPTITGSLVATPADKQTNLGDVVNVVRGS